MVRIRAFLLVGVFCVTGVLQLAFVRSMSGQQSNPDAPAALDNLPNGFDNYLNSSKFPNGARDQFWMDMSVFEGAGQAPTTNPPQPSGIPGGPLPLFAGLGPSFNAQSCGACHQQPVVGGSGQMSELRAGHLDPAGNFVAPVIPINDGVEATNPLTGQLEPAQIPYNCSSASAGCGRSLINQRAICPATDTNPNHIGAPPGPVITFNFPGTSAVELVPDSENVRTLRLTTNILGAGYVEAISDATIEGLASAQAATTNSTDPSPLFTSGAVADSTLPNPANGIEGIANTLAPVLECNDPNNPPAGQTGHISCTSTTAVGRFGWKSQFSSLESFTSNASLNELGVSNRLPPNNDDFTHYCNQISQPNVGNGFTPPNGHPPSPDLAIDVETRFMRATKPIPRDPNLVSETDTVAGQNLFNSTGCAICHTASIVTAPTGTAVNAGALQVAAALANQTIHPYSDFLLHNIGTGDGIPPQDQGKQVATANKRMRTAPLWGLRFRNQLMHDGLTVSFDESGSTFNNAPAPSLMMGAILRHAGEATNSIKNFEALSAAQKAQLLKFLSSL